MSRPSIALFLAASGLIAGVAGCGMVPGLNEQRMPWDRESRRDNDDRDDNEDQQREGP